MKYALLALTVLLSACASTDHARSRAERSQRASELFDQLDTNHDGYLTKAELLAGLRYAGAPDVNPNLVYGLKTESSKKKVKASRKLSETEIQKAMTEAFGTRDAKLDQRITRDEFKKVVVERPAGIEDDPYDPFM